MRIEAIPPERQSLLTQIFISWFPFLLLIGVWIYVMTEDNKDTLLNEVATEHGADNVAFRVGILDTI